MSSQGGLLKTDLLFLLYRVGEPLYFPKGEIESTCYFNVGSRFFLPDYQEKAVEILSRFGGTEGRRIDIDSLLTSALLEISIDDVTGVDRREMFSILIRKHSEAAGRLISKFMALNNINELIAFAAYTRDRINPELFAYAFCTALLHRRDTSDLKTPSIAEMFPQKFINSAAIERARENANIFQNSSQRLAVEISPTLTGNDTDQEHRLAYFREDLGINLHHWHWHLVYPFDGPEDIVRKDRRGELFYFLHQQILARYNTERLCNQMNLTTRLLDWTEPIKEAYFPMLHTSVAGKSWPGRPADLKLANVNRPDNQLNFDVEDLRRWKDNIFQAIHRKRAVNTNGEEIRLDNDGGIDVIGNMIEASPILSPDFQYYGNLHNYGHMAISYIHDPQWRYGQPPGVMSESNTAMRDPIFYRWHAFINDIFLEHKNKLTPYTWNDLGWKDGNLKINLTSLDICLEKNLTDCRERNVLRTFMKQTDVDMSRGLDFFPRGPILARMTHLNHEPFVYRFKINNGFQTRRSATIRIFLAPKKDYANNDMRFEDQKNLMIEMDKYVVTLDVGMNNLTRRSIDSSVTIPFSQTFRNLDLNRPETNQVTALDRFNFCGCGWPQHMLVPKGNLTGYQMQLFMIVTDYEQDQIPGSSPPGPSPCKPSLSFCGLRDRKYPDKRAMGFPFDRPLRTNVNTFTAFKGHMTNMIVTDVTIIHSDVIREGTLVADETVSAGDLINAVPTQVLVPPQPGQPPSIPVNLAGNTNNPNTNQNNNPFVSNPNINPVVNNPSNRPTGNNSNRNPNNSSRIPNPNQGSNFNNNPNRNPINNPNRVPNNNPTNNSTFPNNDITFG